MLNYYVSLLKRGYNLERGENSFSMVDGEIMMEKDLGKDQKIVKKLGEEEFVEGYADSPFNIIKRRKYNEKR